MNKTAMITGATSGIGYATALALAKHKFNVIIIGRRESKLKKAEEDIRSQTRADVLSIQCDVRNSEDVLYKIKEIPSEWKNIDVLVNNAGLAAGLDPIQTGQINDWEKMIDTNIKGLLYVTKAVIPNMIERNSGHIVNISSIAGKEVYAKGNVYCATKHAVDALNKGMRIDLLPHHIKVTCIAPGNVETEFSQVRFKGNRARADKVYEGYTPLFGEDIAEAVLFAVTRPPHVNINDMLIMPSAQANVNHLNKEEQNQGN
jgi:3-hydroxy acid dehydrogenase / malonic semialdehyde reductase